MSTVYTYLAADLTSGIIREEIPFTNVSFTDVLNGYSSFEGTAPISAGSPNKITQSNLSVDDTAIWVLADNRPVWGGILWDYQINRDQRSVSFYANDFLSYFKRRFLRQTLVFNQDAYSAIDTALGVIQAVPGGNVAVSVSYDGTSGVAIDKTYFADELWNAYELLEEISDIADVDYGIEYFGNPETGLFRELKLWKPRGRRTNAIADDHNVRLAGEGRASWDKSNRVYGFNTSQGNKTITTRSDASDIAAHILLEDKVSYPSIVDQDHLVRLTNASLRANGRPLSTVTFDAVGTHDEFGVGRLIAGDEIKCVFSEGFLSVNGKYRITQVKNVIDSASNVTVEYTAQDARLFPEFS